MAKEPGMTDKNLKSLQAAIEIVERSKDIFRSYNQGQENVHDRQLLRDAVAFIKDPFSL